jgi:hypothetical protein
MVSTHSFSIISASESDIGKIDVGGVGETLEGCLNFIGVRRIEKDV